MIERPRSSCSVILAWPIRIALCSAALALTAAPAAAAGLGRGTEAAAAPRTAGALAGQAQVKSGVKDSVDRGRESRRGIVQAVSAKAVVLKELDGSTVTVPVDAKTRVFVDGKRASLRDVKPGFVAVATWKLGKPAHVLRTFDLSRRHGPGRAVVESLSAAAVVLKEPNGSTLTVFVDAQTRVLVAGQPSSLGDVKPGFIALISPRGFKGNKPAQELHFLRPG